MAETHQGELLNKKGRIVTIEDPVSLGSAVLFKEVSDKIWAKSPEKNKMAMFALSSVLAPHDALKITTDVVNEINPDASILNGTKDISLHGPRNDDVIIPLNKLQSPAYASVETFNWDDRHTGRHTIVDGERDYVSFTDGHRDYARELSASFSYDIDSDQLSISYQMQRYQYNQGKPTTLHSTVWYGAFVETGYEGSTLYSTELTPDQEIKMLRVIAKLGDISLES